MHIYIYIYIYIHTHTYTYSVIYRRASLPMGNLRAPCLGPPRHKLVYPYLA